MAPKLTARGRAIQLHDGGSSKEETRRQMKSDGYSKSIISQILNDWPPTFTVRARAASMRAGIIYITTSNIFLDGRTDA